jgi:hypothetical protein
VNLERKWSRKYNKPLVTKAIIIVMKISSSTFRVCSNIKQYDIQYGFYLNLLKSQFSFQGMSLRFFRLLVTLASTKNKSDNLFR